MDFKNSTPAQVPMMSQDFCDNESLKAGTNADDV